MRKRRNKRLRKKGLSAVVTALVIILLVLVSTGTIWVAIKNLIVGGVEEISLGKFSTDLSIKSVKVEGETLSVGVERAVGKGDLVKLKFIFENGTDSEIIERETDIEELDEKSFLFSLGDLSLLNIKKVSIVPVYKSSSGKEVSGDIIDIFELKKPIRGEAGTWEYIGNFEKLGFKGAGRKEYSISSQSENIVKISKAIVDPLDVLPGFNQTFTIHVYSPYGVVSVTTTTELDNSTLNLDLQEIGEEGGNQIFSATWIVNDVHTEIYRTHIIATDSEGNSDSVTLTWTDACQAQISFSDHGMTTKTISSGCNTGASAIGGVDGSNIVIGAGVNLIIDSGAQFIFNSGKSITITASNAKITVETSGSFGNGDLYYLDADGDGYTQEETLYIGSGTGRVRASDVSIVGTYDCSDPVGGQNVHTSQTVADDTDKDRYSSGSTFSRCVGDKTSYWYKDIGGTDKWITSGDRISSSDCDNNNGALQVNKYYDGDWDGYCTSGTPTYCVASGAGTPYRDSCTGYSDCSDISVNAWTNVANLIKDSDQDGWANAATPATTCVGASTTVGGRTYYRNTDNLWVSMVYAQRLGINDCSDYNANVYTTSTTTASDNDQDGWTDTSGASNCRGASGTVNGRTYYRDTSNALSWLTDSQKLGTSDCLDTSSAVNPGITAWYTVSGPNGWDYNCVSGGQKQYTATYGACERCSSNAFYPNDETPEWESLQEGDGFDWIPLQPEGPEGECFDLGTGQVGWIGTAPACGSADVYYSVPGDCFIDDCPSEAYNCYWSGITQGCH